MAPLCEGFLLKKGQMGSKSRYFVLEGSTLTYYGAKEETVPRGQLTLGADSRISEVAGKKGKWFRGLSAGVENPTPASVYTDSWRISCSLLRWVGPRTRLYLTYGRGQMCQRAGFTITAQRKAWTLSSVTNDSDEIKRWMDAITKAAET
jgi:hypothetical protein